MESVFFRNKLMNRTSYFTKETVERKWWLLDLDGMILGKAATFVSSLLIGKHKPQFTPGQDCGDFIVAVNSEKIRVTGKKLSDKIYYRHSGYPGGLKERTLAERLELHPEEVFRDAVKRMLPRNRLGRRLIHKLKIYKGAHHPHKAQKPELLGSEQTKQV